jgi:hypothetical protein
MAPIAPPIILPVSVAPNSDSPPGKTPPIAEPAMPSTSVAIYELLYPHPEEGAHAPVSKDEASCFENAPSRALLSMRRYLEN